MKGNIAAIIFVAVALTPAIAQSSGLNPEARKRIHEILDEDIKALDDAFKNRILEPETETLKPRGSLAEHTKITSHPSPFTNKECQDRVYRETAENFRDTMGLDRPTAVQKIATHFQEQHQKLATGTVTYADYIAHIAECRHICGKQIIGLMTCHIEAVVNSEHELVFFGKGQWDVAPIYKSNQISRLAQILHADRNRNILLIGRASRTGKANYNRWLSSERARQVERAIVEFSVSPQRIQRLALGFESPQISEELAAIYKVSDLYDRLGPLGMNQSVMMVVY